MDTLLTADMVLLTLGLLASGYVSGIIAGLLGLAAALFWCRCCFRHLSGSTFRRICTFTWRRHIACHYLFYRWAVGAQSFEARAVDIEILKSWGMFVGLGAYWGHSWHA